MLRLRERQDPSARWRRDEASGRPGSGGKKIGGLAGGAEPALDSSLDVGRPAASGLGAGERNASLRSGQSALVARDLTRTERRPDAERVAVGRPVVSRTGGHLGVRQIGADRPLNSGPVVWVESAGVTAESHNQA